MNTKHKHTVVLAAAVLALSACGSSSDDGDFTNRGGKAPAVADDDVAGGDAPADSESPDANSVGGDQGDGAVVAGVCAVEVPDCEDTFVVDGDLPLDVERPDDSGGLVPVEVGGMVVGGGLSVEEALATDATGILAVSGNLFADDSGVRMCSVLAESLPPQCGGTSLQIDGFGFDRLIELPDYENISVGRSGDVTWTDGHVTLFGEVLDGTLVIDALVSG